MTAAAAEEATMTTTTSSAASTTSTAPAPRVRPAVPTDLSAVERLLVESDLPLDGVRDAFATFVVAESGDDVIGVAGLEPCGDDALLRSVAVHSAWRSHGIGRALVTRVISDAEARGLRALYLLTTTAERYFPGFGFSTVARSDVPEAVRETAEFRGACPASATVMCRACTPARPPSAAHGGATPRGSSPSV
jgi:amino-acid N-acetyltransferase